MSVDAFDIAERLQTPVIFMSDLDIGMNDWVVDELSYDDKHNFDRGKVLSAKDLDSIEMWGRYLDIDGDGIPYRTIPGTHPSKGSFFTRGTSHDAFAGYTEDGRINAENLLRITKKFNKSTKYLPKSIRRNAKNKTDVGLIYFGSTAPAVDEAIDYLSEEGYDINKIRIRSFPFDKTLEKFISENDHLFILEQNRDAQMKFLISNELEIDINQFVSILNFDGSPLTAKFIVDEFNQKLRTIKKL